MFPTLTMAKNLTLLHSDNLKNYELLDVYLHGNLAFIPAGLGGLNIVSISNPAKPVVLSSYRAVNCDWGRVYAWVAAGDHAYGTGRECGVQIIDVSDLSNPVLVKEYTDTEENNVRYEHAEISGTTLYLARHQAGVEFVDISKPASPRKLRVIPSENAWATLVSDSLLFIADGAAGIKVVDLNYLPNPRIIASLKTSGAAKDLSLSGTSLFVAVGAAGVDMIDVSYPAKPILVDNYNTSGYASRVSSNELRVAVSDWDDVEILDFTSNKLELVGHKNTGGRVMALAMRDDIIYSAEWENLSVFQFQSSPAPDADFSAKKIEFPRIDHTASDTLGITLWNNGSSTLDISSFSSDNADFIISMGDNSIASGDSTQVQIIYQPWGPASSWVGTLTIESNDPDEPVVGIRLSGNQPYGPMVGDPAPQFELEALNRVGNLGTEDFLGEPVLIAFFTSW